MLKDSKAFSGYSATDLDEILKFYGNTLGLDVNHNEMGFVEITLSGGGVVLIYSKDNHIPATYTVLNFPVSNIDTTVDELLAKGVTFEVYPDMNQDEKSIARGLASNQGPDIAWFKDPSGNILSILQTD